MPRQFFFITILLSLIYLTGFAQDRNSPPFTTPNTNFDPKPDPKNYKPEEKNISVIVKKDTRKFLPGNKCYEDATKKMGFMYIAVPKGQSYYTTEFDRNLHNLSVKLKLLFTRGPFWKLKVNKIYKRCRYPYGDAIG